MRRSGRSGTLTGKPAAAGPRLTPHQRGAGEPIFFGWARQRPHEKIGGTPHAKLGRHKRGIGISNLTGGIPQAGSSPEWAETGRRPGSVSLAGARAVRAGGGLANRAPVPPGAKRWAGCAETLFSSSCPGKTSPARPALDGHRKPPRCLTSWGVTVSITWIEELAARQFDRRLTRSRPHVRTGLSDRARAQ